MKKLYHLLFVGTFTIFFPFVVLADINPFSYTVKGSIPNITEVGGNYAITYTITSQYPLDRLITASLKSSTSDFTLTNNCKTPLTAGGSCTLIVSFKPKQLGEQSATLFANDMEFAIINTTIKTTVKGIGHFTFEQNGQPITALNLKPNSVGTVSLKNTGNIDITNVKLSNLNRAGFTNIDCPTNTAGKLGPGEYCTFNYQIDAKPKAATFTVVANGKNADNTPQNLPVNIATAGHFVFEQNGKAITTLTLDPNATGTISLKNTGGVDITDAKVSDLNKAGFTNVNCPTDAKGTLPTGAACTFTYQIPVTTKMQTITIAATGKDVDNTPHNLSVNINGSNCVDEGTIMNQEIKNKGFITTVEGFHLVDFWSVVSHNVTTCRAYALTSGTYGFQGTLTWSKYLPLTASNRKFKPF